MGFCRRCGDIVVGARCRCGGTPVAPVIAWKQHSSSSSTNNEDRWSKTYVSPAKPPSNPIVEKSTPGPSGANHQVTTTTRRFPRPISISSAPVKPFKSFAMSDHITSATSQSPRPPSPLKMSTTFSDEENDIIPSCLPHEPSLSKVYGSVLQPKDTLSLHSCGLCSTVFPPDATIYPDPSNSGSFLCRSCFTISGGSKGTCPSCSRPVLALKSEGGFVQSGGKYWHKQCYNCAACFKNIGDAPMVDLLGRPSCVECFDNCLKRDPSTPKKDRSSTNKSPTVNNPGGLNNSYGKSNRSRESSPAIEELELRLGLTKSRESSPAVLDSSRSMPRRSDASLNGSPVQRGLSKARHSDLSIEDLSLRLKSTTPFAGSNSSSHLQYLYFLKAIEAVAGASTKLPDLQQDERSVTVPISDSKRPRNSESGLVSSTSSQTMQASLKSNNLSGSLDAKTTLPSSTGPSVAISTSSVCGKCRRSILNHREGGQFITVPGTDENSVPQIYHPECFKCGICDKPFSDARKGQVSFVNCTSGPCHTQCAPTETFVIKKSSSTKSLHHSTSMNIPKSPTPPIVNQTKHSMPPPISALPTTVPQSPTKTTLPRFGGQSACPGCQKPVSLMERGVVPGPHGTRWHASCLVCGGKKEVSRATLLGRAREGKEIGEPGCGKKLDSAAKSDRDGGIWCRECLLLLGVGGSPQGSPIRSPSFNGNLTKMVPQFTGISSRGVPQSTGTTTIARQLTGVGGSEGILRQLTGGGLSPTRSVSPTKQLGITRPRPKSVIGMRNTKSIDEGRGMYLVRQFTGSGL